GSFTGSGKTRGRKRRMRRSCLKTFGLFMIQLLTALMTWGFVQQGLPLFLEKIDPNAQYWGFRSIPLLQLTLSPLVTLILVAFLALHKRKPLALSGMMTCLLMVALYGWREVARLAPFYDPSRFKTIRLLLYLDPFAVGGAVVGLI